MSDNKEVSKKDVDPELDDLLDSALQDMTKKEDPKAEGSSEVPQNAMSEDFIKDVAAQFESNMAAILGNFNGVPEDQITQDQIAQAFTKMAEAAAHVLKPNADGSPAEEPASQANIDEVSAAISQTLQNLNTNSENLQQPFSEQDLSNMLGNFNLAEGGQDGNMFVPFMQGMLQSLLSKEVLYPSLKELLDKYPAWLQENKPKIDQADYQRFCMQQELMQQVCAELEPELDSDAEIVKRQRFEKVLDLMQRMQELGQPPSELVGEAGNGFMPAGLGPPAPDAGQCAVM